MSDSGLGRIESGAPVSGVPRVRARRERGGGEQETRDFASELGAAPRPSKAAQSEAREGEAGSMRDERGDEGRGLDVVA